VIYQSLCLKSAFVVWVVCTPKRGIRYQMTRLARLPYLRCRQPVTERGPRLRLKLICLAHQAERTVIAYPVPREFQN
jgi:hypothetical protein